MPTRRAFLASGLLALLLMLASKIPVAAEAPIVTIGQVEFSGMPLEDQSRKAISAWALKKISQKFSLSKKISLRENIIEADESEKTIKPASLVLMPAFSVLTLGKTTSLDFSLRLVKLQSSEIEGVSSASQQLKRWPGWPVAKKETIEKSKTGKIMSRLIDEAAEDILERFKS